MSERGSLSFSFGVGKAVGGDGGGEGGANSPASATMEPFGGHDGGAAPGVSDGSGSSAVLDDDEIEMTEPTEPAEPTPPPATPRRSSTTMMLITAKWKWVTTSRTAAPIVRRTAPVVKDS